MHDRKAKALDVTLASRLITSRSRNGQYVMIIFCLTIDTLAFAWTLDDVLLKKWDCRVIACADDAALIVKENFK